ncbi:hypothetical protein BDV06DRAFT_202388, partial [Aspergillus oleicola]
MMLLWLLLFLCCAFYYSVYALSKDISMPIAISLDMHAITAAYASSDTNVSIIASLDAGDPANNLTLYAKLMQKYHARYTEDYEWYYNGRQTPNGWLETLWPPLHSDLARTAEKLWDSFSASWPQFQETIESSTSAYFHPARILVRQVKKWDLIESIRTSSIRANLLPSDDDIALKDPLSIFTEALKSVKTAVLREAGVNITAALVIYPHSFYNDYDQLGYDGWIRHAASDAGLTGAPCGYRGSLYFSPRTQRGIFGDHASFLLLEAMPFDKWRRGFPDKKNLLLLEQGESYLDVMASSRWCRHRRIADKLGCDAIFWGLVRRLSNKERIQEELNRGALLDKLVDAVMRAREIITAQQEGGGVQAARLDSDGPEEWPVDLNDWWVSGRDEQESVSLRWADVEAVNDEYVESLRDRVDETRSTIQGGKEEWCWSRSKTGKGQSIDGAVILGAYCDASLLTRAIKMSLGEQAKVFGALSGTDRGQYMAQVGARVALWKCEQGFM